MATSQPPEDGNGEARVTDSARDSEQPTVVDGNGDNADLVQTARFEPRHRAPRDAHATIVRAPVDELPPRRKASTFSRVVIVLVLLIVILVLLVLTLFLLRQPGNATGSAQTSETTAASTTTRTAPPATTPKITTPSQTTAGQTTTQLTSVNQSTVEGPLPAGAFRLGLSGIHLEAPNAPADGVNWDLKYDPFNSSTLHSASTVHIDRWPTGTHNPSLSECAGLVAGRSDLNVYSVVTDDRICITKGSFVGILHVQKVEGQDLVADLVTSQP